MVKLTNPSPSGEGYYLSLYIELFKVMLYNRLTKVDGQISRGRRDKCPVHPLIFIYCLLGPAYERKQPAIGGKIFRSLIIREIGIADGIINFYI